MNIFNLIKEIEKVDPEIYDRLDSRRSIFKHFGGFGKKLTAVAVPLAFGAVLNKAYGQTTTNRSVMEVLQFALLLENLEAEFYKQAVAAGNAVVPAGPALGALTTIRDHEVAHVTLLRSVITGASGTPTNYTAASFDFTAKGALGNATFTNYPVMLAVAQAFEDTGVRAYKGQAGFVMSNDVVLQTALQIHSVEARHAAHIRRMRRDFAASPTAQKPWITLNDRGGLPAFAQGIYDGEEVTTQAGVNIAANGISANAASEAFDEPLTAEQVTAIVTPFLA